MSLENAAENANSVAQRRQGQLARVVLEVGETAANMFQLPDVTLDRRAWNNEFYDWKYAVRNVGTATMPAAATRSQNRRTFDVRHIGHIVDADGSRCRCQMNRSQMNVPNRCWGTTYLLT